MDSDTKQRRIYIRNAVICFLCTAICIGIDIRNFIKAGHLYFNIEIGISCLLYALLIYMGIRAVRKLRSTDTHHSA